MLTSLFGDLASSKASDASKRDRAAEHAFEASFAATAIMESVATEVNARGQMVERHSQDLVVSGSPAQAIRDHFANTRADLQTATALITLVDPAGVWAAAVIKALSDAGGRPIERLHLRERSTLRTLATIERTTLVRRQEETLRIYHADVRAAGAENAEIPVALMERSQLTTVIIGPLQPHAIDALLGELRAAAQLATWRCPNLLFMVPPNAVWISSKINAVTWPAGLQVHVLSESMTSASSVWNAMLSLWNQVKSTPDWEREVSPSIAGMNLPPSLVGTDAEPVLTPPPLPSLPLRAAAQPAVLAPAATFATRPAITVTTTTAAAGATRQPGLHTALRAPAQGLAGAATAQAARGTRQGLDSTRARQALASLLTLDGVLGGAIVDGSSGLALALRTRGDQPVDMNLAAAASAQVLRAHRQACRSLGMVDRIDEIMSSAGPRQQVIRTLSRLPELFLVALLDKRRTNLALVRLHLIEIERGLV